MTLIPADRLKQLLHYDPETGIFTRLQSEYPRLIGKQVGSLTANGKYLTIFVDGKAYKAHRLAWLYMTGEWPNALVDHRDRDGTNNKWGNLRSASRSENAMNAKCRRDNKSGFKCVSFKVGAFRPRITLGKERIYLGAFDTAEAAHAAYEKAAMEHFGEFARAA